MNTFLAPAAGGIVGMVLRKHLAGSTPEYREVRHDPMGLLTGILCGLVAISANSAYVMAWAAISIGAIAPLFYGITLRILNATRRVDDALEIFPIFGACAIWGIFSTGFFHE